MVAIALENRATVLDAHEDIDGGIEERHAEHDERHEVRVERRVTSFVERECDGLLARVILHETDHLRGKLIVDYLSWRQKLKLKKQYKSYPEYQDSGAEWLGEIPKGWIQRKSKFVVSINRNTLPETTPDDFLLALIDYSKRERRFGGRSK